MSLINDALKRTRDASYQNGNARTVAADGYRMSSRSESTSIASRSGAWVTVLVLVMAAVAVTTFALRVASPGRRVREALALNSEVTGGAEQPSKTESPLLVVHTAEPPAPRTVTLKSEQKVEEDRLVNKVVEKLKADQVAPVPKEEPAPSPAPELPKFTLHGITSGAGLREAIVNGYTLREGDEVDGARVTAIEARRVKLQIGDREIVLRMP